MRFAKTASYTCGIAHLVEKTCGWNGVWCASEFRTVQYSNDLHTHSTAYKFDSSPNITASIASRHAQKPMPSGLGDGPFTASMAARHARQARRHSRRQQALRRFCSIGTAIAARQSMSATTQWVSDAAEHVSGARERERCCTSSPPSSL